MGIFWNREQLPAELRDKKPEELVEMLKKLEELQSKSSEFESTKTNLETQLNAQKTEAEQMRAKLQEVEQGIAAYQQQQTQQQQQQEPVNPWNDPDRYVDQRTQGTQLMALHSGRMGARFTFKDSLSPRDQKIFNKYEKEVEQTVNAYQPAYQTMPQNWYVAFNYVKGLHEQDISKMEAEGTPFFAEPGSRGAEPPPPPEDKLTPEEEDICRRFHWDPKGYLQRKKDMTIHQAEKGAFARYPVPMRDTERRV